MKPSNRGGLTLVEVLTVIAIIALLAALILGLAGHAQKTAARKKAASEIAQLESFITNRQMKHGQVPQTRAELSAALQDAKHPLEDLRDPWGEDYEYEANSKATYYLWSKGGGMDPALYIGHPRP